MRLRLRLRLRACVDFFTVWASVHPSHACRSLNGKCLFEHYVKHTNAHTKASTNTHVQENTLARTHAHTVTHKTSSPPLPRVAKPYLLTTCLSQDLVIGVRSLLLKLESPFLKSRLLKSPKECKFSCQNQWREELFKSASRH